MYNLTGKVALVTGAARKKGIGRCTALRLAQEGADLAINDILADPEKLDPWDKEVGWRGIESLVAEIKQMGRRAIAIPGDVTDSKQVAGMVQKTVNELGRLDILVNNASLLRRDIGKGPAIDMTDEIWNWTMAVNLTGVYYMSREAAKQMIKQGQGGKIISLSSRNGKQPIWGQCAYSVTKAGVISLTQSLGLELGKYKINVNCVCPGPTVSWGSQGRKIYEGMKKGLTEAEAIAAAYTDEEGGPLGRLVYPDDVANVITFLASNQSDYMTGQAINISGGRTMMR